MVDAETDDIHDETVAAETASASLSVNIDQLQVCTSTSLTIA